MTKARSNSSGFNVEMTPCHYLFTLLTKGCTLVLLLFRHLRADLHRGNVQGVVFEGTPERERERNRNVLKQAQPEPAL